MVKVRRHYRQAGSALAALDQITPADLAALPKPPLVTIRKAEPACVMPDAPVAGFPKLTPGALMPGTQLSPDFSALIDALYNAAMITNPAAFALLGTTGSSNYDNTQTNPVGLFTLPQSPGTAYIVHVESFADSGFTGQSSWLFVYTTAAAGQSAGNPAPAVRKAYGVVPTVDLIVPSGSSVYAALATPAVGLANPARIDYAFAQLSARRSLGLL